MHARRRTPNVEERTCGRQCAISAMMCNNERTAGDNLKSKRQYRQCDGRTGRIQRARKPGQGGRVQVPAARFLACFRGFLGSRASMLPCWLANVRAPGVRACDRPHVGLFGLINSDLPNWSASVCPGCPSNPDSPDWSAGLPRPCRIRRHSPAIRDWSRASRPLAARKQANPNCNRRPTQRRRRTARRGITTAATATAAQRHSGARHADTPKRPPT